MRPHLTSPSSAPAAIEPLGSREARWVMEHLLEGVARFDSAGVCIWANEAYRRMFGFDQPVDFEVSWDRFVHPDDREKVREAAAEYARTGRFECEVRCTRADGAPLVGRFRVYTVEPEEGSRTAYVAFVEDVTEWKEIEAALGLHTAELARSNAELDQFAYIAAHDLQEPARKLLAFTSLLEKDLGSEIPERAARDVAFITDAARRLQALVQDLLALSRAGRNALRQEPLRLDDCVDAALSDLALAIERRGARVERDPLPEVVGDRTLVTQVFHNLLSNALKFCDGSPVVAISCEETTEGPVLGVRDNGIGIEEQYAAQIFQPFKRLHGRDAYDGTGIGLAICRKAVERHGGRIWVESAPGAGAHFRFTLGTDAGGPSS